MEHSRSTSLEGRCSHPKYEWMDILYAIDDDDLTRLPIYTISYAAYLTQRSVLYQIYYLDNVRCCGGKDFERSRNGGRGQKNREKCYKSSGDR